MMTVIPSSERHHSDAGWLSSYWHFSFGDYYEPGNMHWGELRVFNDDIIHGGGGFGMHPHRDMEIITYVIEGQLEHQDHLGNRGIIHPGQVQVMSAGTGIVHAEYNASADKDVHLMQLWVIPRNKNNTPRWEQKQFTPEQRQAKLLPVVSSGDEPGTLAIDQDATIYISALKAGQKITHQNRQKYAYLFVIDGALLLNGAQLSKGDQARIADEKVLEIRATHDAELILLDLV